MGKRLGFGAGRPFNLEEELADDGWDEMNQMLPSGVTAEEGFVMKLEHEHRAAAAKQPRPRPKPKRQDPPKATTGNGLLTLAGAAAELTTSDEHILDLIHSGRLKAVNVGRGMKRPRWRIGRESLEQFTKGRETATPKARTRRRKSETEYF